MDNFIEYYKCGGKTKTPSKPKKVKSCACGSKIKKSNASKKSTKSAKLKIAAKGMKMKGCGCGSKLYRVGGRIVEMDCNNIIKAQTGASIDYTSVGAPIDYAYGPRFSGKYNGYTYDEGLNIQKMLASAGYNVGVLDGKVGKKTLDALKKYENDFKSGENYDNIMNPKRININEYNEGEGTTLQKFLKDYKGVYNGNLDDIYGPKTDKALKIDMYNIISKYTDPNYNALWSGIGKPQQSSSVKKGSQEVMEIQKRLKRNGYDPGPIDGIMGPKTRKALELEKQDNATGYLNSSIPTVSVNPLVKKPTVPVVEDLNERPDLLSDEIYMPGNRSNYRLSPLEY